MEIKIKMLKQLITIGLLFSTPAFADKYDDMEREQYYQSSKQELEELVKYNEKIGAGVRCGVLWKGVEGIMTDRATRIIGEYYQHGNGYHLDLIGAYYSKVGRAGQFGLSQSSLIPCSYFSENPQEVLRLRRDIEMELGHGR